MPQLLGLRVRNFKGLADVTLGQIAWNQGERLPALCCFIGPNGSGKSTLLDALGFMADCLADGVEAACDKPHRGGFSRLRTQGARGPIEFDLYYQQTAQSRPITYHFAVDEERGVPVVERESLLQGRRGARRGKPYAFLKLEKGEGRVWAGEATEEEEGVQWQAVALSDRGRLGITTLGTLREHPRIVGLRSYIQGWYLSYFVPDAARRLPPAGAQKHLDREGSNIGNVLQYFERQEPGRARAILRRIADAIPGLKRIKTESSPDGRLLLRFDEMGYVDPFYQHSMSDGTLKMFAYLLLLEDPEPRPFIGIEEPENGLYHKLLGQLARAFADHAAKSKAATQVLITTHSPYFVDALGPQQVWLMRKGQDGHVKVTRTADIPTIQELVDEGLPLGSLWYSNHLSESVDS
jgi:predicted ATPase